MKTPIAFLLGLSALTAAMVSSGCAWSIGGSDSCPASVSAKPTKGQELMDLKKAHETGAISAEEYERARQKLLETK